MAPRLTVAFIGAGSWALALGALLDRTGVAVRLWEHDLDRARRFAATHCAPEFLPGVTLPPALVVEHDLAPVVRGADGIVFAVPSTACRAAAEAVRDTGAAVPVMVSVMKGLEPGSLRRMSEVLAEVLPGSAPVVLSGPSIAYEVATGAPTSIVCASRDEDRARAVQKLFAAPTLRVYLGTDVIGVELGGVLKNVIALAAGISDGLGLGVNAKGALLTRGLAEMTRLGVALGAVPATFAGLSGVGDLITTSFSRHSRNRFVGEQVGRGRSLADVLAGMVMVAEGVTTVESALALARRTGVEMPIAATVREILFGGLDPRVGLRRLMGRSLKAEVW